MIPRREGPMDPAESIRRILANEPAYYAHKDQLFAGYQHAIAEGREPTLDQRDEARRRRVVATAQVMSAARLIVQRERRRLRDEGLA